MSPVTKSRRRQRRYAVVRDKSACVEFESPSTGQTWRFTLTNISCSGVSFYTDDDEQANGLEPGASYSGAAVRIADCVIRGDLVIMHITPEGGCRQLCGALLYPASDTDLVKLKSVIAGMEAVGAE